ncbi:hypothetical protein K432DRAFT_310967, partial [Lepidopterella palustris CBS 459.81]
RLRWAYEHLEWTKKEYRWDNIVKIWFPANSPGLNPVKNAWKKLKDAVYRRQPRRSQEMRQVV